MDIARHRLTSQKLVGSNLAKAADAVKWLVAVQAQDYAGAKWALAVRVTNATDAAIEQAFARGDILRTHIMRPTWHFVAPGDIRWLLDLTAPRVQAANAPSYRKVGLDAQTLRRSDAALARALEGGEHTRDELRTALDAAGVATAGELRMSYLLMHAELESIVCSGPRRGKQFTYALLDDRVRPKKTLGRDDALAVLARRYFESRGPATVHDFAKWSGLTVADGRSGLDAVRTHLQHETIDAKTYWFSASNAHPPKKPGVRLLSVYDEYVSGYKDRSAIITGPHAALLSRMGSALTNIIVVDGRVTGSWRRRIDTRGVSIELAPFAKPTATEMRAIKLAAKRYSEFLGLKLSLE